MHLAKLLSLYSSDKEHVDRKRSVPPAVSAVSYEAPVPGQKGVGGQVPPLCAGQVSSALAHAAILVSPPTAL